MGNDTMESDWPAYGAATLALHADDTLNTVSDAHFRCTSQPIFALANKV